MVGVNRSEVDRHYAEALDIAAKAGCTPLQAHAPPGGHVAGLVTGRAGLVTSLVTGRGRGAQVVYGGILFSGDLVPPPPLRAPLPRPLLQSQRAESANTHAHNTHTTRTHKQTHTQTNTPTHTHTHTPPPAPSCNLTSARAPGGGGALPQGRAVRRGASLELRRRARPPARQSGEFRPARFDQF